MQRDQYFVLVFGLVCVFFSRGISAQKNDNGQEVVNSIEDGNNCQCANFACGCCIHLDVPKIDLNDTGCVNITYLSKEYGISFTISLDGKVIYNETVSVTNPPPYCVGVPYLKAYAALCVKFYQLSFSYDKVHGCVKLEARLAHTVVAEYNIGCFNIGSLVFYNKRLLNRFQHLQ